MASSIEQRLGNYHLTRLLGRGGFANVYYGEHIYLKTPAAIKVVLATWYIRSKKTGLHLSDHAFPRAQNSFDGQGNPVLLAGWREEESFRQDEQVLASSMCSGKPDGCKAKVLFSGILTHDDDCLAPLVSLKKGRRGCLRFKPPSDTHGAGRLRSV